MSMKGDVIFDLDGTLVDSLQDIGHACNHALKQVGAPERNLQEIRSMVGGGVRRLLGRALNTENQAKIEEARQYFGPKYFDCMLENTQLYDGLETMLDHLLADGYQLFIATNKPHRFAGPIIEHLNLRRWFLGWASGDEVSARKPSPEVIKLALRRADREFGPNNSLYVGDMEIDNQTAHNAGCKSLQVRWGFGKMKPQRFKPDYEISSTLELHSFVREILP